MNGTPSLIFEPVGQAGATALAQVHAEAFDHPWSAEELARSITGPGAFAIKVARGDDLLGFVIARAMAGEAEVITLAVRRHARRGGIGEALMDQAIATALAFGAGVMWLEVAVDNVAAIVLYERMGFETTGRRRNYYAGAGGARTDALIMRRALNSAAG